jgi:hypothetical protein
MNPMRRRHRPAHAAKMGRNRAAGKKKDERLLQIFA